MALDEKVRAYLRELGAALNDAVSSSEKVHDILAKVKAEGYEPVSQSLTLTDRDPSSAISVVLEPQR